jgi:hypothetical protein
VAKKERIRVAISKEARKDRIKGRCFREKTRIFGMGVMKEETLKRE